ncbi:MAG: PLP-dependent aminotransferase family protein, partial [Eubacterium sp.]|nr:PLP-dependent aminotransferase family protein [Eubacterium sp.]
KDKLMEPAPSGGVPELREAIADHLASFRGMAVSPDRIIIGAGAEYLYGMIIKLLGDKKIYAIENPGYRKLAKIYESSGANVAAIRMDHDGILIDELKRTGAAAAHVSPTHHFPTGITMPISRRYELLAWANESPEHYIIEDDFDSEFRLSGSPIPSLQSLDACGKVIYMNTFSKSLAPTIRIGYMVLPWKLVDQYYSKLGFYSCTVSNFEQYTLAAFIREGYFEKHINRTRLYYVRKRRQVLDLIRGYFGERCRILENKAGLHFLLQLDTDREDDTVKNVLKEKGIKIRALSDYYMGEEKPSRHIFLIHYSDMNPEKLKEAMPVLASALSGDCSMLKKKRGKMKSSTAE